LVLEHVTTFPFPDVFYARYRSDGDRDAYVAGQVGYLRAYSEPALFGTLDPDRTAADRVRLADACYARVAEQIARDPVRTAETWQLVLLALARPEA